MTINNIKKIFKDYKDLPSIAIWKAVIIQNGVNTCFDEKIFKKYFSGYKIKYAIKNPKNINYEVLDRSSNTKVIPSEIILSNNHGEKSLVKLRFNKKSPIGLTLFNHCEKTSIKFYIKNKKHKNYIPLNISLLKERGDNVVGLLGEDRLSIILFDGCWNWNIGKQCLFCDLNPKRSNYHSVVPSLNDIKRFNFDYKKWWQKNKVPFFKQLDISLKKIYPLAKPHKHLLIMSGGFIDNEFLWQTIVELIKKINNIIPLDSTDNYLNVPPPGKNSQKIFQQLKQLGIKQVQINLEVVGKKNFSTTCPGKDKSIGYETYKKTLKTAAEIFGKGHARSNFVFINNSSKELLKEATSLAKDGIVMDYSIFQPKKGTPWANKETPSIKELLDFTKSLAKIYKKNKFKSIYCPLSSRSSIINELINYDHKDLPSWQTPK